MCEREEIYSIIRNILRSVFGKDYTDCDFDAIGENDRIDGLFEMNSIIGIQIIVCFENELDFEFDDEDLTQETVTSLKNLADCYYRKAGNKESA